MSGKTPGDPGATQTGEHRMLPVGTVLADRYELVELVGMGGMGIVYRARDRRLDLDVAVKVLDPQRADDREMLARFERELVLARQVSHPNVVRIHDIGQDGPVHFLTMDFVRGEPLDEIIEGRGALPVDEAVGIAADLANALAAAHEHDVVHRDLKPANVLVDGEGRAHVTDFGVARSLATPGLTRTGRVMGTPHYLSPEQAMGNPVDGRSDIYALGLLLFEILSGRLPFGGESYDELLAQRISGRPRSLASLDVQAPAWLQAVIDRCLQRDPQDRYPDARALLDDLRAHRASQGFRRRWPLAGAATLVLAGALAGAYWLWPVATRAPDAAAPESTSGAGKPQHTVAVVPFVDQTGQPTLAWVSTGVPEMINVSLAEAPGLQIVDSLRVHRTVDDLGLDPGALSGSEVDQLSGLLNADRLVTGRVMSTGSAVHVEAVLLDAGANGQRRRFSVDAGSANELLGAVDRLAGDVRQALGPGRVSGAEAALSPDPRALAGYSDGVDRLTRGDTLGAVRSLQAATGADAHFAAAWVRLADAYQSLGYHEKASEAAQRAVEELDRPDGRIALQARALKAVLAGNAEQALEFQQRLVQRFPNDIEARVTLAEMQGNSGTLEAAIKTLGGVVDRDPNHPRAWYLLGKFSILSGDSQRAINDYLVRALVIQNRLENPQGKADVLNALGIAYNQVGDLAQSQENYEEALKLRRQVGDRRGVAATLTNLSRIQSLRGDYEGAGRRLSESLQIKQDIGDSEGVATTQNEFGVLEEEQGHYAKALQHYREALKVRQDLGDDRALAESYNNVGYAYYLLGEYDNAAVYARQALERYQADENREGAMLARQTLAQLETARGNWESALSAGLASLKTSRDLEYPRASAVSLGVLGKVAFYQGRYGAAMESYAQALKLVESVSDARGQVEYLLARAVVFLELGASGPAADALDSADKLLAGASNREQHAELLRLQGLAALQSGDAAKAAELLDRAVKEAAESGGVTVGLQARLARGWAMLAQGQGRAGESALGKVAGDAAGIGHVPLELKAREYLARAQLADGEAGDALDTLRAGLSLAGDHSPYGRAWRLQLLQGLALKATGGDASGALAAADAALQSIRGQVPEDFLGDFNAQEEVTQLNERLAATSR